MITFRPIVTTVYTCMCSQYNRLRVIIHRIMASMIIFLDYHEAFDLVEMIQLQHVQPSMPTTLYCWKKQVLVAPFHSSLKKQFVDLYICITRRYEYTFCTVTINFSGLTIPCNTCIVSNTFTVSKKHVLTLFLFIMLSVCSVH